MVIIKCNIQLLKNMDDLRRKAEELLSSGVYFGPEIDHKLYFFLAESYIFVPNNTTACHHELDGICRF